MLSELLDLLGSRLLVTIAVAIAGVFAAEQIVQGLVFQPIAFGGAGQYPGSFELFHRQFSWAQPLYGVVTLALVLLVSEWLLRRRRA